MNLRKTIAGAAIALGGATVMLGLGGTANAAVDGNAAATPNLDLELGKVANAGNLASIDTNNPAGKIDAINFDAFDVKALVENIDAGATGLPGATLLGYDNTEDPSNVELGALVDPS
ncbi:MAG: hypothetical protein ABIQ18_37965 [Umezawaea sp.]|jgi:hypothetical protein